MTDAPPLPRSVLFVPADRPALVPKAARSGADAVCLDLEDGVADAAKADARVGLSGLAGTLEGRGPWVRLTAGLEAISHDLAALPRDCAAVVLPKVRSLAHIELLDGALSRLGHDARIVAMVEDAAGLTGIEAAGPVPSRLAALCPGTEDLAADLGTAPDAPLIGAAFDRLAIAARAMGVGLMGFPGPIAEFRDTDRLAGWLRAGRAAGALGAFVIHPAQVAVANDVFAPSEAEIAWARAVTAAFEDGAGVAAVEGRMVDRPVWLRARAILGRAG